MTARRLVATLRGCRHAGYGVAQCLAVDDRTQTLSVREEPDRPTSTPPECFAGCSPHDIGEAPQVYGLLPRLGQPAAHHSAQCRRTHTATKPTPNSGRTDIARDIWRASRPTVERSVEPSLRSRRIMESQPPCLQFHADVKHGPTSLHFPFMIALNRRRTSAPPGFTGSSVCPTARATRGSPVPTSLFVSCLRPGAARFTLQPERLASPKPSKSRAPSSSRSASRSGLPSAPSSSARPYRQW